LVKGGRWRGRVPRSAIPRRLAPALASKSMW